MNERHPKYPDGYPPLRDDPATYEDGTGPLPNYPLSRFFLPVNLDYDDAERSGEYWSWVDANNAQEAAAIMDQLWDKRGWRELTRFSHQMWRDRDGTVQCVSLTMEDALTDLGRAIQNPDVRRMVDEAIRR